MEIFRKTKVIRHLYSPLFCIFAFIMPVLKGEPIRYVGM